MKKPSVTATVVNNAREQVRVSLVRHRGQDLIDVRMAVELNPETGAMVPTKKGLALSVEKLPELIAALRRAMDEARRRGLLDRREHC